jgi:hypothetical protein
MGGAELFNVLVGCLVGESREGVVGGVCQSSPAKHRGLDCRFMIMGQNRRYSP